MILTLFLAIHASLRLTQERRSPLPLPYAIALIISIILQENHQNE
ncbi:hypothetical protein [Sphaerospermopsis sp. LEGE 08334]|nr:hypothetical protein [Sphaerospermopsis sp. LEGE 08334]